jgi:iron complex outermembrane receptor protein
MTQHCIGRTILLLVGASVISCLQSQSPAQATSRPSDNPPSAATQPSLGAGELTSLSLEDLMNVEVTSVSKEPEPIAEAAAAVSVISQDDIARSGFSTIPDLLQLAPGVDVQRINSFTWAVGVRGLNDEFTRNLLVMDDGRSLYSPFIAGVFWDLVDYPLDDLDHIEVIRGPGATLWGANAVNGVISITSKDSADTQGWLLSTRASNEDSDFTLRYGGKLSDDTTYRVYVKDRYFNEFDGTTGSSAGDEWYSMSGGFRIDNHASDTDTLTMQGDFIDNQIHESMELPVPTAPFTDDVNSLRNDMNGNLLARWDHHNGAESDFSLQTYYDFLSVDYPTTDYNQHTFDIDFHDRFQLAGWNEVSWGMGYRIVNSAITTTPWLMANPATDNLNFFSGFVQDKVTLQPDRWSVTFGTKVEHNDFSGFDADPSIRLLWTPDKQNSVWAAFSYANRTPSRIENDATIPNSYMLIPTGPDSSILGASVLYGNPDQLSEKLTSYEIGYRMEPSKSFSVDTAIFYNSYDKLASLDPGAPLPLFPNIIPLYWGNQVHGYTYGGEISSTLRLSDHWRLTGSYSLLEAYFQGLPDSAVTAAGDIGSAPAHQAQIHSYLDITRNLQLNAGLYYIGHVAEFNIPKYFSGDLSVVWIPKDDLSLTVGIMNLFDDKHVEYGITGAQGLASEIPLTVYAQLSCKF